MIHRYMGAPLVAFGVAIGEEWGTDDAQAIGLEMFSSSYDADPGDEPCIPIPIPFQESLVS